MGGRSFPSSSRVAVAVVALSLVAATTVALSGGPAGAADASAPVSVSTSSPAPIMIEVQPNSTTVAVGQSASFVTLAFSPAGSVTVDWQVSTDGGTSFVGLGASGGALTVPDVTLADSGNQYRAVFTAGGDTAVSEPATLTVDAPPVVTEQPQTVALYPGQSSTFSAAATGTPTPTVQWQLSTDLGATWADVPGLTSPTFTSGLVGVVENGWEVRAAFTNSAGTVTSNPAALVVTLNGAITPVVVTQPLSQDVAPGQAITFTAAADAVPTPTVQWQLSTDRGATWIDVGVFTSSSFTSAPVVPTESGWEVRAVFSNFLGTAVSDVAVGTVT